MLPVEIIKIDGQFIRNVATDTVDYVTVRCIVQLAKALGRYTTAEFVDSQESRLLLEKIGVDYLQGYHIHRPEPIESMIAAQQKRAA